MDCGIVGDGRFVGASSACSRKSQRVSQKVSHSMPCGIGCIRSRHGSRDSAHLRMGPIDHPRSWEIACVPLGLLGWGIAIDRRGTDPRLRASQFSIDLLESEIADSGRIPRGPSQFPSRDCARGWYSTTDCSGPCGSAWNPFHPAAACAGNRDLGTWCWLPFR